MSNLEDGKVKKTSKPQISPRRRFFSLMAQSVGLSALGGMVWSGYLNEAKASNLTIRPPGAVDENDFLKMCIKCGQCVEACPFDTLSLAKPGDALPIGTPYFIPREIPCYMCVDIPCVPPCPTGALDQASVSSTDENDKEQLDINKSRMGLAVVDEESCVAFWGIQCDACHRACPLIDQAIRLEYRKNSRTGKHAYLLPVVDSQYCTGCGLCEHACITDKAAIYVLPHKIAQGEVGSHYIKGWDQQDEKRLEDASSDVTTVNERSKREAVDYLNDSGGLFDE